MKNLKTNRLGQVAGILIFTFLLIGVAIFASSFINKRAPKAAPVKNILLVHGAWADGSGWEGVYNILKKDGYNVSIVSNSCSSLSADVAITKAVLNRQDGPVILVGHSYGGAIITEVGDDSKVAGLVYVAAFAPDQGESLFKMQSGAPADPKSPILPPKDGFIWLDVAKYHKAFCADVPESKANFMAQAQVPLSSEAFSTSLTKAAWKSKPSWYILTKSDHMIPPPVQESMAKRANAKITQIDASHAVYISHAAEVAKVIEEAAKNSGK